MVTVEIVFKDGHRLEIEVVKLWHIEKRIEEAMEKKEPMGMTVMLSDEQCCMVVNFDDVAYVTIMD